MSAPRPPYIHEVMIAAADLENAEFERDRLVIACGEAIRQALSTGLTHAEIGLAANLPEVEVRRLAEAPGYGPDVLGGVAGSARSAQAQEASLISLDPSLVRGLRHDGGRAFIDLTAGAAGGPDAAS
ncbi:hypothetical protein [Arthrobacter sp. SX1312]|uniref:hypothetical protein n=1 Tax=Arthrobacter sp. SX1312 TaxID=2058896 RepID=UPI0011B0CBE0|nr:hypothetical protein [Arthrobacter sp. SX1312]